MPVALILRLALSFLIVFIVPSPPLLQISSDPYSGGGQHPTQVEPDTFGFGSTVVAAFQVGRYTTGGASNIGWATTQDGGATWTHGELPGITAVAGGPYARGSDPVVAYSARDNVWLITTLALGASNDLVISRSTDGGLTWGEPILAAAGNELTIYDKQWLVCDNTASSPFYGRCYLQWDDAGDSGRIKLSTSTDSGLTWGPPLNTAGNATGLGGQPLVRPDGTVVVPIGTSSLNALNVFRSTDGGMSWSELSPIAQVASHTPAAGLRSLPLPSAEIDADGKIYLVWADCRFRTRCAANDLVLSTSVDGLIWSEPVRIPIDSLNSGVDHFIPGLAVDSASAGATARLALTYYSYAESNCDLATCRLNVGFISSTDGGATWSSAQWLAGPMQVAWLPSTSLGRMVGDYISTSIVQGRAVPVFSLARKPSGSSFDQAIHTVAGGLPLRP
ncbi:MAG: sialidase family protein [Roseiflexaceae bacterium]